MKNVLLLFLSDIHLKKDSTNFQYTIYNDFDNYKCVQTNESAIYKLVQHLKRESKQLDAVFYFATKLTQKELTVTVDGKEFSKTHEDWFKTWVRYNLEQENKKALSDAEYEKEIVHFIERRGNNEKDKSKLPCTNEEKKLPKLIHVLYDEYATTDESIRQITEMAQTILNQYKGEKICLHADMTGGFRHASMMMLSVMQLLKKHSGVEIGQVLYSNWQKHVVEEVTEIHRMFTLISGVDEFVNFGSVKEIEQYFECLDDSEKTEELKELLKKMREFSDAIKICRPNKIANVVKELKVCIDKFQEKTNIIKEPENEILNKDDSEKTVNDIPLQEKIFAQIITVLRQEYGPLWPEKDQDIHKEEINIIRWCIDKGFLQQAMTLCTEWIPAILVDSKICYTEEDSEAVKASKKLSMGKYYTEDNWKQTFISTYNKTFKDVNVPKNNTFQQAIEEYRSTKNKEVSAGIFPEGQEFLFELFKECEDLLKNDGGKVNFDILKHKKHLQKACRLLWASDAINSFNDGFAQYIQNFLFNTDKLLEKIGKLPSNKISNLIKKKNKHDTIGSEKLEQKAESKKPQEWNVKALQYNANFDAGIMKTDFSRDDVMALLEGYYNIRTERNQVNHALEKNENDETTMVTNKDIREIMVRNLEKIEELLQFDKNQ